MATRSSPTIQFLRLHDTALALGISPRTLRQWVAWRLVPCYRPTRRLLLFDLQEVSASVRQFRVGGAA